MMNRAGRDITGQRATLLPPNGSAFSKNYRPRPPESPARLQEVGCFLLREDGIQGLDTPENKASATPLILVLINGLT